MAAMNEHEQGLRILALEAENVKRLRAVEIRPDPQGGLVIIGGANAAGKTSVLDSILYALGGEKAIPAVPIREGETHAEIRVDLGFPDGTVKFRVTRSITPKGNYLKLDVPGEAGLQAKTPQKLLDKLLGALSFDPLAFTREKPTQQRAILLAAVGLQGQMDEINAKRKEAFDERTDLGREVRSAEGYLKSLPPMPQGLPDKRPDVPAMMQQLEAEQELNYRYENAQAALAHASAEVERLENQLEHARAMSDEAQARRASLREVIDLQPLRQAINAAEGTNRAFDVADARLAGERKRQLLEKQVTEKGAQIEACDQEKVKLITDAKLPVEGLGCAADGVTYQGLPFDQAASSVKLQVSAAIGMALNPTLRVMRIEDGSLLDGSNLLTLAEMARCGDFQIWIERVGGDDAGAIIIEDGTVAGAEPQEVKADAY